MMPTRNRKMAGSGVTLVEVIFAIGVILIGMVGLLSVLPLAGRRGRDAISLSVGANLSQRVMEELDSRNYLADGRLSSVPPDNSSTTVIAPSTPPFFPPISSISVDPAFASVTSQNLPAAVPLNGYSQTFFPYYKQTHNPLVDPSTTSTSWPSLQPRLARVGILTTQSKKRFEISGNATDLAFVSPSAVLDLVEDSDDLNYSRPDDQTLNATSASSKGTLVFGGLEYGKRFVSGEYTWFATVNPLAGTPYSSVSIVVMRNRTRNFVLPTTTTAPPTAKENAVGERLAYVTFASGFTGGAGGTVHLTSAKNTVSDISSSDWVMLSKTFPSGDVHRWYRVVGVDGGVEEFITDGAPLVDDTNLGAQLPAGMTGLPVWRRRVLLDGPDWSFDFRHPVSGLTRRGADSDVADNTYATIVAGVVSVTERLILTSDL